MLPLSMKLPTYVSMRDVVHRRQEGFVLQASTSTLTRMAFEGWTITPHGPYSFATCPPPELPDIPTH